MARQVGLPSIREGHGLMSGHAKVLQRPSSVVGHLPPPSQLVQGTRSVATRAAGRAADLTQPLQHIDVGQVAHTATRYVRRRPTKTLTVLIGVGFVLGFVAGWWTKSVQHRDRAPDAPVERDSDPLRGESA